MSDDLVLGSTAELKARIQSLEAELAYQKSHHTARYVVDVTNQNEQLDAKVAALTEVLTLALGMLNAASVRLGFSESAIAKDVKADIEYVLGEINKREISKALGATSDSPQERS